MKQEIFIAILFILNLSEISAQYEQEWVANYGVESLYEETFDNYVDVNNQIYSCGYATEDQGKGGIFQSALILKYDQDGVLLWSDILDSSEGGDAYFAITGDINGNIYVAGQAGTGGPFIDGLLSKYSSDGVLLWSITYNSEFDFNDAFSHITLDEEGNICVGGYSDQYPSEYAAGSDFLAGKFSSDGDLLWIQTHNGIGDNRDVVYGMNIDSDGNVYVTGTSGILPNDNQGNSGDDAKTVKYSSNGTELWVANYHNDDLPDFYGETPRRVAVDSQGNVVVCGWAGNGMNMGDFLTIQYDSNGNQLWIQRFDESTGGEGASALFIDENDNILVAGSIGIVNEYSNYVVVKYTSSGEQVWMTNINGEENADDYLMDGVMDDEGNIYLSGYGNWNGENETYPDYMTVKINSEGQLIWLGHYNGVALGEDYGLSVAIDEDENIFTTGVTVNDGSWTFDATTVKYSPIEIIGIDEAGVFNGNVIIAPNPAEDVISIRNEFPNTCAKMSIVNALGQEVYSMLGSAVTNSMTIDLSQWESGMYYVLFSSESGVETYRFMKH
jgi:hypothetical protein